MFPVPCSLPDRGPEKQEAAVAWHAGTIRTLHEEDSSLLSYIREAGMTGSLSPSVEKRFQAERILAVNRSRLFRCRS